MRDEVGGGAEEDGGNICARACFSTLSNRDFRILFHSMEGAQQGKSKHGMEMPR